MLAFHIWIGDLAYQGESDCTAQSLSVAASNTFHDHNGGMVQELLFAAGQPVQIRGQRNLRSHIDRILRALGDGKLPAGDIKIELLQEMQQVGSGND